MWTGLLELLIPSRCGGCGAPGTAFCTDCIQQIERILPPYCGRCGTPLPAAGRGGPSTDASSFLLCTACNRAPPVFDSACSLGVYAGGLRRAICGLKFLGRRASAAALGELLAAMAPDRITRGVVTVVPVPLHPARLKVRGFNQSELLARPVARRLGVRCLAAALRRIHQERPQSESPASLRADNVLNAFHPGAIRLSGTVLLVDDVYSTGATASACALALKDAGAERVVVLTLARALLRSGTAIPPGTRR